MTRKATKMSKEPIGTLCSHMKADRACKLQQAKSGGISRKKERPDGRSWTVHWPESKAQPLSAIAECIIS